jgi:hypothetical protein
MSIHSDVPHDLAHDTTLVPRGAAPVGLLHELPLVESMAILFLRSWCQGGLARAGIAQDFDLVLSQSEAVAALYNFDSLMGLVLSHARRNLMRHDIGCACFGGDESAFANLIGAAVAGDTDDSMLFATNLLLGPAAFDAVMLARALAKPLLRLARHSRNQSTPVASSRVH